MDRARITATGIRRFSSPANASSKEGKVVIIALAAWRYVAGGNLATGRRNIILRAFSILRLELFVNDLFEFARRLRAVGNSINEKGRCSGYPSTHPVLGS